MSLNNIDLFREISDAGDKYILEMLDEGIAERIKKKNQLKYSANARKNIILKAVVSTAAAAAIIFVGANILNRSNDQLSKDENARTETIQNNGVEYSSLNSDRTDDYDREEQTDEIAADTEKTEAIDRPAAEDSSSKSVPNATATATATSKDNSDSSDTDNNFTDNISPNNTTENLTEKDSPEISEPIVTDSSSESVPDSSSDSSQGPGKPTAGSPTLSSYFSYMKSYECAEMVIKDSEGSETQGMLTQEGYDYLLGSKALAAYEISDEADYINKNKTAESVILTFAEGETPDVPPAQKPESFTIEVYSSSMICVDASGKKTYYRMGKSSDRTIYEILMKLK